MRTSLALAALLGLALAAPAPAASIAHVIHERRDLQAPGASKWTRRSHVPVGRSLPVRIGLSQQNLDIGHDLAMEVADPASPRYGKYYTEEEIHDLFAPHEDTVESVRAWLHAAGIENVKQSVNKQWMMFDTAVEKLEALLKTKYHEHVHVETGEVHVACDEYHVPEHLVDHIDYVTPGIKLAKLMKHTPTQSPANEVQKRAIKQKREDFYLPPVPGPIPTQLSAQVSSPDAVIDAKDFTICNIYIAPQCVPVLYNVSLPSNTTAAAAGPRQIGIFEDIGQWWDQKDLNQFYKQTGLNIPQGFGPKENSVDGAPGPQPQAQAGLESMLDLSLVIPLVYPSQPIYFQVDDLPTELNYTYDGFLNNLFDAIDGSYCTYSAFGETGNSPIDPPYPDPLPGGYKGKLECGAYKPTNVISISYGGSEDGMPVNYQRRQCNEIMKLGMQGVTVVASSGDSGVAYRDGAGDFCLGPYAGDNTKNHIFAPQFPVTCPYVLAVGATYLPAQADVFKDAERAVSKTNPNAGGFNSGGGFSNIYPQPSYQKAIVQQYLADYPPPFAAYQTLYNETSYNNSGFGANGGVYNSIGRAYPDIAAIGANVLDISDGEITIVGGTSASCPVVASILAIINMHLINAGKPTVGFVHPVLYANPQAMHDITVGNNKQCSLNQGFTAEVGWDPVTGLGTPNYPELLSVFMNL